MYRVLLKRYNNFIHHSFKTLSVLNTGPGLTHKHNTRLERNAKDEHSSLSACSVFLQQLKAIQVCQHCCFFQFFPPVFDCVYLFSVTFHWL